MVQLPTFHFETRLFLILILFFCATGCRKFDVPTLLQKLASSTDPAKVSVSVGTSTVEEGSQIYFVFSRSSAVGSCGLHYQASAPTGTLSGTLLASVDFPAGSSQIDVAIQTVFTTGDQGPRMVYFNIDFVDGDCEIDQTSSNVSLTVLDKSEPSTVLKVGSVTLGQVPGVFGQATVPSTDAFELLTGVNPLLWLSFSNKKSGWPNIEGADWQFGPLENWLDDNRNKALVYSFAPIPDSEGMGTVPLTKCANGEYNSHYEKFANYLESHGLQSMILRVGWEWQGDYYPWGVGNKVSDAQLFAKCFRNVVTTIRAAYPTNHFLFDWNPTYGVKDEVLPAAWPGDDYVDMIGIDIYDQHYGSCGRTEPCRWNTMQKNLDRIKRFADSKGKPLSFPEFGIWQGTVGGGDNPYFIRRVCEFAKDPNNKVMYFNYFEANAGSDHRLSMNPLSAEAYRTYCR